MKVDFDLLQFHSIIDERTAARLELDRVLIRGHVPERYQAVQTYVQALDKCIAELEAWIAAVRALIDQARQPETVSADDTFWALCRAAEVELLIASLRQERDLLAGGLAEIDELNAAPYDREEPSNGTAPHR